VKYLCAILAFIVLTLSVQPVCASQNTTDVCCSENVCNEDQDSGCDQDKQQKECSGSCNPFQICGCCAFSIVPSVQQVFLSVKQFIANNTSWAIMECPFIEEPVLGFWQPPKLA
jgi:hypothetical protein